MKLLDFAVYLIEKTNSHEIEWEEADNIVGTEFIVTIGEYSISIASSVDYNNESHGFTFSVTNKHGKLSGTIHLHDDDTRYYVLAELHEAALGSARDLEGVLSSIQSIIEGKGSVGDSL